MLPILMLLDYCARRARPDTRLFRLRDDIRRDLNSYIPGEHILEIEKLKQSLNIPTS